MVRTIRARGFHVRVITREVQHIAELKGIVDLVSISLDSAVLALLPAYQTSWTGIDVEYSLVLPPIPTADIALLKPQYEALRKIVNGRLILRENLNSIYPLDLTELSFGHRGIVFVPKQLCLNGRYLSTIDSTGHELVQDNERLAAFLMDEPEIFLFGSFVRHIVNPALHMEYDDIDVIALSAGVMDRLSSDFSLTFTPTSPSGSYPRYYQG
jgi:hypothetical protein